MKDKLILPEAVPGSKPSWFGFLITCKEGVSRNDVVRYVEEKGVQTRMLFAGNLTKHPCFDQMRAEDTFWVGLYPGMTESMIDYMAKVIKEAL